MGEIKRWQMLTWGGLARRFIDRRPGDLGDVSVENGVFIGEEMFVLASDHDAAMAEKDAENDRLVSRLSGRLREEVTRCAKKDDEIRRLKAEKYAEVEVRGMKLTEVYKGLLAEKDAEIKRMVDEREGDARQIMVLNSTERSLRNMVDERDAEIKALKAASSASAPNVTISVDPREMCAEARHHMDRMLASLRG